ncbi:MAG: porin [Bacteroidales bacterium]|nr:porin [Bacteroidales bacterium]
MVQLKKTLTFSALLCLMGTGNINGQSNPSNATDWTQDLAKRVEIDAYAQGGFVYEHTDGRDNNTFEMKRAIMTVAVPISDRWFGFFMHDFSSVVQEYYATYRVTNNKAFNVKLGQFKNALSYENSQSPTGMEAIDVYAEGVTYLTGCGSDRLMGTQYGRDLGLAIFGQSNDGKLKYELNVMNGQGVNKKDLNNEKDFIGKLEYSPVEGLNFIASGQIGRGHAVEHSVYNPTIAVGENYKRNRWTAGFSYNSAPIKLHGEYVEGQDGDVTSRGAYLTTTIPVAPKWDVVGSYDFFNFNTDEHMDQHKFIVGLQYWIYKRCRFQMQYVYKSASLQNSYDALGNLAGKEFRHGANHAIMAQIQVRLK